MKTKKPQWQVGAAAFLVLTAFGASGCGYHFRQTGRNLLLEKEGVRRVYIQPFKNTSYHPGVENLVYNQVLRAITMKGDIRVVNRESDADAILYGDVGDASYSPASALTSDQLFPPGRGVPTVQVATVYAASLSCNFQLVTKDELANSWDERKKIQEEKDRQSVEGTGLAPASARRVDGTVLWSGGFARSMTFPGNNRLGVFGTTSHLINESEFERALQDLSERVALDMTENLFSMF